MTPNARYVAKVLYTYILGYKFDFGHMYALNLISSHNYSEKQIVNFLYRSPLTLSDPVC